MQPVVRISEQVAKGGYSTASEYIRNLIRQELERVAKNLLLSMLKFTQAIQSYNNLQKRV
jgi:Arc/MetJ-type ribon-helix-helix transcriptional regulator